MICKGCSKNKKLIKAHVIPESFFVGLRDEKKAPLLITDKKDHYPKKIPIGIYDKTILCRECEDIFQKFDDYAQSLLLKEEHTHTDIIQNGVLVGYSISNVDVDTLKLFFLSLLWRASISKMEFYSKINLGPHEQIIKKLVWEGDSGEEDQYSFVVAKFTDGDLGRGILDPHMERWFGINYARFYMFGYVVYIKLDKRSTPKFLKPYVVKRGQDVIVLGRRLSQSKELPLMKQLAKEAKG